MTGLDNAEIYYFELRAETSGGKGEGATSALTTLVSGPPAKPTGFTATPSDTVTEVKLAWTDPSDDTITGYEYRQTTAGQAVLTWDEDGDATGWQYHQSVDGSSNYGEWMDITVDDTTTTVTTTISGINPHLGKLFELRVAKAGGYEDAVLTGQTISGDFTDSFWNTIGTMATIVSHEVTGLDLNNNTYFFEVQWVKPGDVKGTVTTLTLTYLGSVTLSWDDPKDSSITKYQYRESTKGGPASQTPIGPIWKAAARLHKAISSPT